MTVEVTRVSPSWLELRDAADGALAVTVGHADLLVLP